MGVDFFSCSPGNEGQGTTGVHCIQNLSNFVPFLQVRFLMGKWKECLLSSQEYCASLYIKTPLPSSYEGHLRVKVYIETPVNWIQLT